MEKDFATIPELCQILGIHPNTARNDINELAESGILEKKYGGVSYIHNRLPEDYYQARVNQNKQAKASIGRRAAKLIEDGDVIFVDAGSTTSMIFNNISALPEHLTVITNNLDVINKVFNATKYTIYVLPGKGDRQLNSLIGTETVDSLKAYNIQKAFIGAKGITAKGDMTGSSSMDAKIKSTVIEISSTVCLMADSEKTGKTAMINFANLDQVDYWVCDEATDLIVQLAQKHNVKLLEAENITK